MQTGALPRGKWSPLRASGAIDGNVRVVIEASDPALARAAIRRVGGSVERTAGGLVQASCKPMRCPRSRQAAGIDRVRVRTRGSTMPSNGEAVAATLAAAWHAKGFTGKGVKVAVIDGGFYGLAERQAAGDLPGDVVTQDLCRGELTTAEDHGTAVAEIVHEMAPDAQLYLVCIETDVDLAAAVAYAKTQGVHVINHSAGWEGPFRNDGSGPFGAIVAGCPGERDPLGQLSWKRG